MYTKPEIIERDITISVNSNESDVTSCYGGRCERERYGQDH
jgi:hypothetical protein